MNDIQPPPGMLTWGEADNYTWAVLGMSGPPEHANRAGQVTYPCPGCGAEVVHGGPVHVCGGRVITGAPTVGAKPVAPAPSPTEEYNAAEKGGAAGEPKEAPQVCTVCGSRGKTTVGKEWRCWSHAR